MPKISALPPIISPDGDDPAPVVDDSASATKKITLTQVKEWLQSLVGWITTAMIDDGQVTSEKLQATIACKAYRSTAFNITTSEVKLTLNAEVFDVGSDYDTTNGRFVAPVTGYYRVSVGLGTSSVGASTRFGVVIYVNGASYARGVAYGVTAGGTPTANVSDLVYLTAGQYIELYIEGSTTITGNTGADRTFMSINFVGV